MIYSLDKQNGLTWQELDDNFLSIQNTLNSLQNTINTLQSSSFTIEYMDVLGVPVYLSSSITPKILIVNASIGSAIILPDVVGNNYIYNIKHINTGSVYTTIPISNLIPSQYIESAPTQSIDISNQESVMIIGNKINTYNIY